MKKMQKKNENLEKVKEGSRKGRRRWKRARRLIKNKVREKMKLFFLMSSVYPCCSENRNLTGSGFFLMNWDLKKEYHVHKLFLLHCTFLQGVIFMFL
jgi:hypothetical protein